MFRTMVEQMLKEYDDYKPGDLVRIDLWYGRVLEHIQPDMYKVTVATPDGREVREVSKNEMEISYPVEFAMNWNGCGGNTTDILDANEWDVIKENHPEVYKNCLKKVAMNTSSGSMLGDWIFEFLMSEKNEKLHGRPAVVIDQIKHANMGPIMKYMLPDEQLNDAIIRLMKEAVYMSGDHRYVIMSY